MNDPNIWVLDLAVRVGHQLAIFQLIRYLGEGFLIYVFDDCDNDGSSDLPIDLYVSGSHNQNNVTISGIPQIVLSGNHISKQYRSDISKTNLSLVVSVWDDASTIGKHIMVLLEI